MSTVFHLQDLLKQGKDTAVLRFSLGRAYYQRECFDEAVCHLAHAVRLNPDNPAAWKLYACALVKLERVSEAVTAYETGIVVAYSRDEQSDHKELQSFLSQLGLLN